MIDLSKYSDIQVSEDFTTNMRFIQGVIFRNMENLQERERHVLDISYLQEGRGIYVFITHGEPIIKVL